MKKNVVLISGLMLCFITLNAQWTDYGSYIGPTSVNHVYIDGLDGQNLYFENNGSFISSADSRGLAWSLDSGNSGGDNNIGTVLMTQYYDYVNSKLHFDTDWTDSNGSYMTILQSNGRVGIGTATPAAQLHVNGGDIEIGDTYPFLTVNSTTGNAGMAFEDNGSSRGLFYWYRASDALVLHRNSSLSPNFDFLLDRSTGFIGLGNSTPVEKLDVNGAIRLGTTATANNGTIRWTGVDFEGYKSGAWVSLTSLDTDTQLSEAEVDAFVADNGYITSPNDADFDPTNEIELPAMGIINDVLTWDGADWIAQAPSGGGGSLWSQNGASIYFNTGSVGIGTTTPAFELQVVGDVDITGELTAASDLRFKKNIAPLNGALDLISKLNPVCYDYRVDEFPSKKFAERRKMGLIAQEVEQVLPNLVSESGPAVKANGETLDAKSVNYMEMVPVLIKAVQELQEQLEQKDKEIAEIKALLKAEK